MADAGWWRSKEEIEAARAQLGREQAEHSATVARREMRFQRVLLLACILVLVTAVVGALWLLR